MVIAVIELSALAGDDAPRAAVLHAGRRNGVLVVIAAFTVRKTVFEIPEHDAVAVVGKGSARAYRSYGALSFSRKSRKLYYSQCLLLLLGGSRMHTKRRRERDGDRGEESECAAAREAP